MERVSFYNTIKYPFVVVVAVGDLNWQMNLSWILNHIPLRFVVLHDAKNDDGIKGFCQDVYEIYVKVSYKKTVLIRKQSFIEKIFSKFLLNPFYNYNQQIQSESFDRKVRASAKRYFGF